MALARLSLVQSSMLAQVQAGNDVITRPSLGSVEGGRSDSNFLGGIFRAAKYLPR